MASFVILLTARTARIACSDRNTYIHTYRQTDRQTDTQNDYCNPRCACAPRVNESTEVQTLGVIRIQLIYSINVLSKYSSLISHRPSIFEGRHIDHRSSKIDTSITDLRRSTHQSPIFEGRHVDHRSSKVNTSISEGRNIHLQKSPHRRRSKAETSHLQFVTEYCPQLPSKSLK